MGLLQSFLSSTKVVSQLGNESLALGEVGLSFGEFLVGSAHLVGETGLGATTSVVTKTFYLAPFVLERELRLDQSLLELFDAVLQAGFRFGSLGCTNESPKRSVDAPRK